MPKPPPRTSSPASQPAMMPTTMMTSRLCPDTAVPQGRCRGNGIARAAVPGAAVDGCRVAYGIAANIGFAAMP